MRQIAFSRFHSTTNSCIRYVYQSHTSKVPRRPPRWEHNWLLGSLEDRLIGLFAYASRIVSTASGNGPRKCLIMLNDIGQIFSLSDDINEQSPRTSSSTLFSIGRRCKALFLTICVNGWDRIALETKRSHIG
mmetsp:Transcript_13837/g.29483  ORF Transcript_13837/g.29483 Transcript_13837/m.29483 type:complete len:132 (-) Transcript_13837:903-1298(-)